MKKNNTTKKNKCFVLTCSCYTENGVSVYWNKSDAYIAMSEEIIVESKNLGTSGYNYTVYRDDCSARLFVPDSDIYYDWNIVETEIQ